jgi:hypothetical protein
MSRSKKRNNTFFLEGEQRTALAFDVGTRNFSSASVTLKGDNDFEINYMNKSDIARESGSNVQNVMEESSQKIADYTINHLFAHCERMLCVKPNIIIIEQQAKHGIKFRSIGIVIQTFFRMYYQMRNEDPPNIIYQSGSQKLKVVVDVPVPKQTDLQEFFRPEGEYSIDGQVSTKPAKEKTKYKIWKDNKNYTVQQFRLFLMHYEKCNRWLSYYDMLKKKDDVADTVFHAIWVLKMGGTTVPKNHPKKVTLRGDEREPPESSRLYKKLKTSKKTDPPENEKAEENDLIIDLTDSIDKRYILSDDATREIRSERYRRQQKSGKF